MKSSTRAQLTLDRDEPIVMFYDAVNHGQAQAGSFSGFLGCKKRIEDAIDYSRINTRSGIGYTEPYVVPRF